MWLWKSSFLVMPHCPIPLWGQDTMRKLQGGLPLLYGRPSLSTPLLLDPEFNAVATYAPTISQTL